MIDKADYGLIQTQLPEIRLLHSFPLVASRTSLF